MLKTFTEFTEEYEPLEEAAKNLHMTHAEDSVLYGGVKGVRQVIDTLRDVRDTLGGSGSAAISTKLDGSPALFFGEDPSDKQFFVAKKGIFNKDPKIYKSNEDIDSDLGGKGNLADLFKIALNELPKLGISKGRVIQGDVMFTKSSKKKEDIDGKTHITFHPNTIVYAVPTDTPLGKQIDKADFGIVIHTVYKGATFEGMSASFNTSGINPKKTSSVWIESALLDNVSDVVPFNDSDYKELTSKFSAAGKLFKKVSSSALGTLEKNPDMARLMEQYNNTLVRKGESIKNTKKHAKSFMSWIADRVQKDIDSKKSAKGKATASERGTAMLNFFAEIERDLPNIYDLQNALVEAKGVVLNKLNQISGLKKFVLKKDGYHATNEEGFVAINSTTGNAVKLVDRLTFSHQNFSPEILKQWMR